MSIKRVIAVVQERCDGCDEINMEVTKEQGSCSGLGVGVGQPSSAVLLPASPPTTLFFTFYLPAAPDKRIRSLNLEPGCQDPAPVLPLTRYTTLHKLH